MSLQFLSPEWLLALALVPVAVWLGRSDERMLPRRRRWSVALRVVVLLAVIVGLAQPRVLLPVDARSVAFVLDVSDSVPPAEKTRAEGFVAEALEQMEPDDSAAVVVFGTKPLIDRPARFGELDPIRSVPGTARTDIGSALRLGTAVLPADTARRLVLLSDGRSNLGQLEDQLDLVTAQGVPVDVVPLAAAASDEEVLLRTLEAPANTRIGQRFDLVAVVSASSPARGRLRVYSTEEVLFDRDVELTAGDNRFTIPVTVEEPGFRRFRAEIVPQQDGRLENNRAAAFTVAAGEPKVMVVASSPDRAGPLLSALKGAQRNPELVRPEGIPNGLIGLSEYDAVVLVDVEATELAGDAMRVLEAFVRDLGHGLVMVGGEDSFGAGGYRDSPIEKALPVDMEVRDKERRPGIAIAYVIDKSGSMAEGGSPAGPYSGRAGLTSGGRKVDLAKEAVAQAAALIEESDSVALIAFDDRAHRLWPLQPHTEKGRFESVVAGIDADGGTNIYSGLVAAVDELGNVNAPLKHVLLLTDGWSDASGYGAVLSRMDDDDITLSVVAVGAGSAPYLEALAEDGGGRYYAVTDPQEVPQIFVEETMVALGTYVIEERFQPVPGSSSQVLTGLDAQGLPPLNGYNGTTEKQSARVALWSHLDDPVLAQWQYGLGRSVAWTSDLKRQWATDWVDWDSFAQLAVQLVDWTLPAPDDAGFATEVALDGTTATIRLRATGDSGAAINSLDVVSRLSGPSGQGLELPLTQTAAGEYSGSVLLPEEGTYLLRVIGRQEGQEVGAQTSGFVVPYSPEYADPSGQPTDPRLWRIAELTDGRILDDPTGSFASVSGVTRATDIWPWLFLLAAFVFPFDIGVRRLNIGRSDLAAGLAGMQARLAGLSRRSERAGAEPVLGSLFAARDRARARMSDEPARAEAPRTGAQRSYAPAEPATEADAKNEEGRDAAKETEEPAAGGTGERLARLREAKKRAQR